MDFYQGQTIERLDVAALGPGGPVPPGVSRRPGPGQYYASPALAALLRSVPNGRLGDRFPGSMAGTIGDSALSGPDELAVYVGYRPSALAAVPGTGVVTAVAAGQGQQVFTPFFRYAFAVGVLAVLFPILILIATFPCSAAPAGHRPNGCAATDLSAAEAGGALSPQAGATLVSGLRDLGGTVVYPLYLLPQAANPNYQGNYIAVMSCSVLRDLAVLGQCAPGVQTVQVSDNSLVYSDNPCGGRAQVLERLVYLAVALTILVAGCSLAVAVGGGLADRKRPFTLLRVSGTPVRTLYRVMFLEAVLPLATASVVTAALAYGMSVLIFIRLAPPGTAIPQLGHVYYATMGAGLVIALMVIGVTLPLLNRMTSPDNARFE